MATVAILITVSTLEEIEAAAETVSSADPLVSLSESDRRLLYYANGLSNDIGWSDGWEGRLRRARFPTRDCTSSFGSRGISNRG